MTTCVSLDCSSASLILGSVFARSRLRNAWTIYSASWARKVMQLWPGASQLMKPMNKIWRNSLIILRAPWMTRSPPEFEYKSLKISRRALTNQSMNSHTGYANLPTMHRQAMVAMLPLSLRSKAGSFQPSQMPTSSCSRNSSRSIMTKKYHIYWRLATHIMPLSLKQL